MAGIYLHIPYCKQKCHYCDFHFSTNLVGKNKMVQAICAELDLRKDYLSGEVVNTIYFGGGTPSLMSQIEFQDIIDTIKSKYTLGADPEVTVECNPDDLSLQKLIELKNIGVNRLSIGIQSFDEAILKKMNRAHNELEARTCVEMAKSVGFENITIDLIYGLPNTNSTYWNTQVIEVLNLGVQHVSAYCLTIEHKTVFGQLHRNGDLQLPEDEESAKQFDYLVQTLAANGFEQYEISNFAKDGYISKHNSAYWLNQKYLGVGPSAHSFNRIERGWNISNNAKYVKEIEAGQLPYEIEVLTPKDKFNDYILTRLRTKWGIELEVIDEMLYEMPSNQFKAELSKHLALSNLTDKAGTIVLSNQGKFIADKIAADLFV